MGALYLPGRHLFKVSRWPQHTVFSISLTELPFKINSLRALQNKDKYSGCTVHYVTDKLDSGKIILQKKVKITKGDDQKTLARKVLKLEHKLYPSSIKKIFF